MMLLIKTPLNTLVDESKPGHRICLELKRLNSLKIDSRVSSILSELTTILTAAVEGSEHVNGQKADLAVEETNHRVSWSCC